MFPSPPNNDFIGRSIHQIDQVPRDPINNHQMWALWADTSYLSHSRYELQFHVTNGKIKTKVYSVTLQSNMADQK